MSKDALLAELKDERALLCAARALRARGHRRLRAFTPFHVEELPEALGLLEPRWPAALALAAGLLGGGGMYALAVWINLEAYPIDVGGRPLHAAPAFVMVAVPMLFLIAGLALFAGLFAVLRLRYAHPLFHVPAFQRASIDRFFLLVSDEEGLPAESARAALLEAGASRMDPVEDER